MRTRRSIRFALTGLALAAALAVAGCSAPAADKGGGDEPFTIGFSNSLLSQEVRTQFLEGIKAAAQPYIDKGELNPIVEEVADTDVQGQVRQIQNLMNRGVDAMIVIASSDTGLNPILTQAKAQGIEVIVMDNFVDLEGVYNVGADYYSQFNEDANMVLEAMGGKGGLLRVDGVAGFPANQTGIDAVDDALKDHPDANLMATLNGNWDTATTVQVVSSWLAAGNVPDGVWATGGGVAYGVLTALLDAGLDKLPPVNGEGSVGWLRLAAETKKTHPEFAVATHNLIRPQTQGSAALQVAMLILQGENPKAKSPLLLPTEEINNDNYQQYLDATTDLPDSATISGDVLTADQVREYWF